MAGFREARGDAIVTIDGDLQDDPAEIPRLLDELEAGADLVSGWKRDRRTPWSKRAASKVFNGVTAAHVGRGLHDLNCGFKAYRAEVVRVALAHRRPVPLHPGAGRQRGLPGARSSRSTTARASTGAASTASSATCAGFLDLLTILFIGRFRQRPMHLFGGRRDAVHRHRRRHLRLPGGAADHGRGHRRPARCCCSACC